MKDYAKGSYDKANDKEQWIRISEGCPNGCEVREKNKSNWYTCYGNTILKSDCEICFSEDAHVQKSDKEEVERNCENCKYELEDCEKHECIATINRKHWKPKEEVEKSCFSCKHKVKTMVTYPCCECYESTEWQPKEQQEDKPKKLKLRIKQKTAKRLQEILCKGCTDTTACGICIACLDRYVKAR